MICTLTCNAALDYAVRVNELREGTLCRADEEHLRAGGKGINVSLMLHAFGVPSVALGFAAGFTGDVILEELRAKGIDEEFIRVEGFSRINVKLLQRDSETEINGRGPVVTQENVLCLVAQIAALPAGATLVLAGSVPDSLPRDFYARLLLQAGRDDFRVVVDASGELLAASVACKPWLIKPNLDELSDVFQKRIRTRREASACARELCRGGVQNVIVSMGGEGALLVRAGEEKDLFVPAFRGKAVDTVGAGDALLAGFLAAKEAGKADAEALRFGVAAGSATAFRNGLATSEEVFALLRD